MKTSRLVIGFVILCYSLILLGCAAPSLPPPVFDRPYNYPGSMTTDPLPDGRQSVTIGVLDFTSDISPAKMPYLAPDLNVSKYFTDTLLRMMGDKKINTVHINGKCPTVKSDAITEELMRFAKEGVDYYLIGSIQECSFIDSYRKSAGAIKVVLEMKLYHLPSKSVVFSKLGVSAYESVGFAAGMYEDTSFSYKPEHPQLTVSRSQVIPESEISRYFENIVFNTLKTIINDPLFVEKIIK